MSEFLKRYKEMGQEIVPFKPPTAIRTNILKITPQELRKRLEERGVKLTKIPYSPYGFIVESRFALSSTPEHLLGYFYIQEAASQVPVEVLKPKGITVDCCAAPGGKTTQMAMYSDIVLAYESNFKRIDGLKNNLERLGISNCIVYNLDARKIEGNFDKILVDAPCSGNMLADSEWLDKQTLKNVVQRSELQKEILGNMIRCMNSGGELVYSTCSLEPEEDEMVVDWALKKFDVELMRIDTVGDPGLAEFQGKQFDDSIKYCRRLWPNKTKTQGFFVAKFKR
ncbi:MAG: RsmB/NOP family class I SAM-dependent RNA methyltransferase [Nanoarchaeota archaeon]